MNLYFRYCKMFFSFSRLVPALYLTSSKQKLCPVYWCSEMKNQPENMQRLPVVLSYGLIICCDSFTEVWLYITPLTLCCICAFVTLANALVYWYVFVVHFFVHVLADFYILIICMFPCFYHLFAYMLPFICCFFIVLLFIFSFIVLSIQPLSSANPYQSHGRMAYPNNHRARGRLHPGWVTNLSPLCCRTNRETDSHSQSHTYVQFRIT